MYLLVLLVTLGYACAGPVDPNVDPRSDEQLAAQYVLPGTAIPSFYDVILFLDPGNAASFRGRSSVRITAETAITQIVLHAMELQISSIRVIGDANPNVDLFASQTTTTDDRHLLTITLSQALVPQAPYTIYFEYTGAYATNMFGLYISSYQHGARTVNLITSQLQPTFARRVFPCFDEPRYKAVFRTTIYAPEAYPVVRSNTNLRTDTSKPDETGFLKYEFDDTLVMSTYLLAYLVSEFEYLTNEGVAQPVYRIPFRVYARPEARDTAQFALDFGQENMRDLEEYTDFPYAFEKLDKVAVPDFAAGAMENWGIVIYREVALLVTPETTTNTLQNIGRIITHENMHQWFGNEVSPVSWTYTWLNEGFANFFENFATDFNRPTWRMMDQYILILQNVMQSDAVLSVNPMTHPVYTPSQIIGTFNAVAYQKSGSVIRMMQHFLTPPVFRDGLRHYLKTNPRQAVVPSQLYVSLQQVLDASDHTITTSIANIMERWTTQGGFPMLQVNRTSPVADSVTVRQRRYLTDSSQSSDFQWHVPMNWVLSTNVDFTDTKPQAWLVPSNIATAVDIPGLKDAEWFLFNKQQTGYYRVNYEPENWAALAAAMNANHEQFHILNRAQLLDDSFNMARTGYLDYRYPLDMSRYLEKEKDYIPWGAVNPSFTYLDLALAGSPVHNLFRHYLLNLTAPLYAELGFTPNPATEEHVTAFHRNIILDINCRHGNPQCIESAQQLLQNFRENGQTIPADLQSVVYCSSLRGGDVDNFNYLWQLYLASSDSSQQSILLNSLGCTSDPERRTFFLNQIIDPESQVREQDRHTILVSVINASPDNMNAALEFSIEQWPNIQPRVQGLSGTSNILTAFSRRLTTEVHRERIEVFEERHGAIFSAAEEGLVGAIKENIAASIDWSGRNAQVVEEWLEESFGEPDEPEQISGAASISASLVIISSAILAMLTAN